MAKKILSLLLAALMLAPAMIGCSETTVNESTENGGTPAGNESAGEISGETEEIAAGEERVYPELPDDLNFDGHTFTIMNNDYNIPVWSQIDIVAEEMTGEAINDAVFTRNSNVSDKYNCVIASEKTANLSGELPTLIQANDDFIDIATVHLRTFADHALEGYYIDVKDITSMDLTKPWYDQNSVEEVSIMNLLYGVATDITLMDEQATGAMVFSKSLYTDHQLAGTFGDFYELVREGKWTLEALNTMATSVSADKDGDGSRTENDLFGLLYQRDTLTSFFTAFGINIATKNADDIPEMTLMTGNNVDIMDQIFNLIYQPDYCMNVMAYFGEANWSDEMVNMFQTNNALLMWIRLADVENLRAMETDFGIIPVPKYTEEDPEYRSAVNSYVGTLTCIPQTNYNPEMTGYFIEALASESRYVLLPEYYEINLQGKVSRDQESREMLDIIFANRHYDLGEIYDPGDFANILINMTMVNDRDIASKWARSEKMINKILDNMVKHFGEQ